MCCSRWWMTVGAVLAGLAVVTGAFAAHGLDDTLIRQYGDQPARTIAGMEVPASWKYLRDFQTAATYQMYHALALVAVGLLTLFIGDRRSLQVAAWSFLGGIVLFSGSLYVLVLTGMTWLGRVTPFGGLLFLVGWVAFAMAACPCNATASEPETVSLNEPPAAPAG